MSIVETIGLAKDYGGEPIFSGVDISIERKRKIAVVGRNGSGKTTFARIIAGLDDDFKGVLRVESGVRIAYVPQKGHDFLSGETVLSFACRDATAMRQELEGIAERMASPDSALGYAALSDYARLREIYDAEGGDQAEETASRLLERVGLGDRIDAQASSLSGGERNVLALVKELRRRPDLLILDEPGNHLDVAGLAWLEEFIAGLPYAVLMVSHDRRMLDRVADEVFEVEGGSITRYKGNYSAYRLEKLRRAAGQGQEWQADRKRVTRLEELVRRFAEIARSRPDPAWGKRLRARRSQLERVKAEAAERPDIGNRDAKVDFLGEASKAYLALAVTDYEKSFGDTKLVAASSFTILNGERVALVGPNGSGKTSFIRDLVSSGSWDNGTIRVGPSMVLGYCAQHQETFEPSETVEEAFLKILPTKREVLAHVGKFLFSYADLDKRIAALSGGELNRLQLARASALRANFLVLDEPTNHLDIPTREAVEEALEEFDGAVLVVSHDRYLLDKVAERVVFIEGGRFHEYEGSFGEYWRDKGRQDTAARRGGPARSTLEDRARAVRPNGAVTSSRREGTANAEGLEDAIEQMERQKEAFERRIAEAFDGREFRKAKEIAAELERHNARLDELWSRL